MPGTHVTTTVQKFIVVVMPGTHVTTTVQIFIVVVMPGTHVTTTVAIIYREGREEGRNDPKSFFKLAKNWICIS